MKGSLITVQLFDKEFTIKTEESPQRMEKVVDLVSKYLNDIQKQKPFKDRTIVSLLTALNIAAEYMEIQERHIALENEVNVRTNYLINLIDDFLKKVPCGVRDQ